jgi:hypothetical protein
VVGAVRCAGSAGSCTCAWVSMTATETGIAENARHLGSIPAQTYGAEICHRNG